MISGIAHINLTVPEGTLDQAAEFYGATLGLPSAPVPELQKGTLLWYLNRDDIYTSAIANVVNRFDVGSSGQQVHVSFGTNESDSRRHPCFKLDSREDLEEIKTRIFEHSVRGGLGAPMAADKPGETNSGMLPSHYADEGLLIIDIGAQGKEYPTRFFARDYAGNRLEFTM
jgi:catechol 2,3-dioxygenase-like lactoylglutathione lyase family enzyme